MILPRYPFIGHEGWWFVLAGAVLCMAGGAVTGCGGGTQTLTAAQMEKLAPALQRVLCGEAPAGMPLPTETRTDGVAVYSVILRITDADAVRGAGIPLNSVQGRVATARLSVSELRQAARLDAVIRIDSSGQSFPTR